VPHARVCSLASPSQAEAEAEGVAWRGVTSGRCGAVGRTDGRTDGRDVLRGGSIFLLLMTP
jgi:hypothetical protein